MSWSAAACASLAGPRTGLSAFSAGTSAALARSSSAASGSTASRYAGAARSASVAASQGVQVVSHSTRPSLRRMHTRSDVPHVANSRSPTTTGDDALNPGSFVIHAMFRASYAAGGVGERYAQNSHRLTHGFCPIGAVERAQLSFTSSRFHPFSA